MANTSPNPFVRVSNTVLIVGLAVGTATAAFDLRLALLPVAALFGWSQIGGL